jgi:hypothetical protein
VNDKSGSTSEHAAQLVLEFLACVGTRLAGHEHVVVPLVCAFLDTDGVGARSRAASEAALTVLGVTCTHADVQRELPGLVNTLLRVLSSAENDPRPAALRLLAQIAANQHSMLQRTGQLARVMAMLDRSGLDPATLTAQALLTLSPVPVSRSVSQQQTQLPPLAPNFAGHDPGLFIFDA